MLRGRTDSLAPGVTAEARDPERLLETIQTKMVRNSLHMLKTSKKRTQTYTHVYTYAYIYILCMYLSIYLSIYLYIYIYI